jgi:outer membrane protein insertion porin family/translocation and assembly module TamA
MVALRLVNRRAAGLAGLALCVMATGATSAEAQRNRCSRFSPRVDEVRLDGARRVSRGILAPLLYVQPSGFWRRRFGWDIGPAYCLDSTDVARDVEELRIQYVDRGFIAAQVTGSVERFGDRQARVTYTIREGEPVRITAVIVRGLPPEAADSAALARQLIGQPFDDSVVTATADSIQARMRDAGYARAAPEQVVATKDSTTRTGTLQFTFTPGRLTYIDSVAVRITSEGGSPALPTQAIRTAFGVRRGAQYSARSIGSGQREVSALDLYRQIRIDTVPPRTRPGTTPDSIGLVVTLIEGDRYRARTTGGWGTLDCFRTQTRFTAQNFAGLGHRLELTGLLSKIGVAEPFSGLSSACAPRVRDDPFSQLLNYYAGATVRLRGLPPIGTARWQPEVTLFSERRSQLNAYEQTTEIGLLGSSVHRLGPLHTFTAQYTYTDTRTRADRAVSCTRFGFCRLEDVASFVLRTPVQSIGGTMTYNPLAPNDDPVRGARWNADLKFGHANIGKIFPIDFGRFQVEGTLYRPIAPGLLLAVRGQVGGVVAQEDDAQFLPPGERFYSGGQNSVRGFRENLLGPGSYIVSAIDTVAGPGGMPVGEARGDFRRLSPSGGNAMWVANVELRTSGRWPVGLFQWVAFVDMGRVWNTRDVFSVTNANARATPGLGVRLLTPLGPFRLDVGYNPNNPEPGPAFLVIDADRRAGTPGRAICVSPGSDDPLTLALGQPPSSTSCPATYRPPRAEKFLTRLQLHFSLGHAF